MEKSGHLPSWIDVFYDELIQLQSVPALKEDYLSEAVMCDRYQSGQLSEHQTHSAPIPY
jgi:hypothetical protein